VTLALHEAAGNWQSTCGVRDVSAFTTSKGHPRGGRPREGNGIEATAHFMLG